MPLARTARSLLVLALLAMVGTASAASAGGGGAAGGGSKGGAKGSGKAEAPAAPAERSPFTGKSFTVTITEDGATRTEQWQFSDTQIRMPKGVVPYTFTHSQVKERNKKTKSTDVSAEFYTFVATVENKATGNSTTYQAKATSEQIAAGTLTDGSILTLSDAGRKVATFTAGKP